MQRLYFISAIAAAIFGFAEDSGAASITSAPSSIDDLVTSAGCVPSRFSFDGNIFVSGQVDDGGGNDNVAFAVYDGSGTLIGYRGESAPSIGAFIIAGTNDITLNGGMSSAATLPLEVRVVDTTAPASAASIAAGTVLLSFTVGNGQIRGAGQGDCWSLPLFDGSVDETLTEVAAFLSSVRVSQAAATINSMPLISGLQTGAAAANVGDDGGTASFSASFRPDAMDHSFGIWTRGSIRLWNDDRENAGIDGAAGYAQVGADLEITSRLRVGGMVQTDLYNAEDSNGGTQSDGFGFLTGPYAVYEIADDLVAEGILLGGLGFNETQDANGDTGTFESGRALASASVAGTVRHGAAWFRPRANASFYIDRSAAFSVGSQNFKARTITVGSAGFSQELGYDLALSDGVLTPSIGIDGVATYANGVSASSASPTGFAVGLKGGLDADFGDFAIEADARLSDLLDDDLYILDGSILVRINF